MTADEVRAIFDECGTDKGRHGYAPFYASLATPRRLLEIGVATGASLKAWRRMWPQATIFGVDVDPHPDGYRDSGITVLTADATTLQYPPLDLDLIIDDGSHRLVDQLRAREHLYPCLRLGGVYVIEDVFPEHIDNLVTPGWRMERTGPGWDDQLVIHD